VGQRVQNGSPEKNGCISRVLCSIENGALSHTFSINQPTHRLGIGHLISCLAHQWAEYGRLPKLFLPLVAGAMLLSPAKTPARMPSSPPSSAASPYLQPSAPAPTTPSRPQSKSRPKRRHNPRKRRASSGWPWMRRPTWLRSRERCSPLRRKRLGKR
jgi:hypothetical protein